MVPALLVVVALVVFAPWFHAPLSFDEAYNLQVVRNLVDGHGYATDGAMYAGHRQLFDYQITTGPTLLLPVAAVVAAFGEHVWVYRLVPVAVSCALVVAWYVLIRRHWGAVPAVVAGAAILMVDNAASLDVQRFGAGSVMGENASVLFLVLAALALRWPWVAGALAGLAVLTKVVLLLAVPGIAVGVVLTARREARSIVPATAALLSGVLVPTLLWQAYRVSDVGFSGNWSADRDYLSFLTNQGGSETAGVELPIRILKQLSVFGAAGLVACILALVLVVARFPPTRRFRIHMAHPSLVAVAAAGAALEAWWLVIEGQGWIRHSTQATELLVPLLAAATAQTLQLTPGSAVRNVLTVCLPVLVVVQMGVACYHGWRPPGPSLSDQRAVAAKVAARTDTFVYPDEPQAFELTILAPVAAQPLSPDDAGEVMVLSGARGQQSTHACGAILYRLAGYVVCRVP